MVWERGYVKVNLRLTRVRYSERGSGVGEREGRLAHGEASMTAQSFLGERKRMICYDTMVMDTPHNC